MGLVEGVAPDEGIVSFGVTAFETDNGYVELPGYLANRGVKEGGEGVGGVDDEADVARGAEGEHGVMIHASRYAGSVLTLDLLGVAAGRVVVRGTRLVKDPDRDSSFCCSPEN